MSIDQNATNIAPKLQAKTPAANPLAGYFRQPAIYVNLPSGGKFWPEGALDMPESGELPVYPLTSRDEIMLRTPDALMNGQSVINVIESCVPNIKDAWNMPAIDTDYVLIAMRIASYGHSMDFKHKCNKCSEEHDYSMDLRYLNSTIKSPDYESPVETNGLRITFRPATYKEITELNKANFEISRTTQQLDSDGITDEVRSTYLQATMERVVEMGQKIMVDSTLSIEVIETGDVITSPEYIAEFYKNIDVRLSRLIQEALSEKTKDANIKPQKANCQSCGEEITLNILFDYASFFVVGS